MLNFAERLKAASKLLSDAEKQLHTAHVELPPGEASGILVAARHLVERVLCFTPDNDGAAPSAEDPR